MGKAKRKLTNITFNWDGAHIAICDESEPACSGADEPVTFKSVKFTENQKEILEELDVDITLASKSQSASDESNNGSQHDADNKTKPKKEDDDNMSDEKLKAMQEQLDKTNKKLANAEASNLLAGFDLEADLKAELIESVVGLEDNGVVVAKALASLVEAFEAAKEEAVTKAVEAVKSDGKTELQKSLEQDAGEEGESEDLDDDGKAAARVKSIQEKIAAAQGVK